MPFGTLQGFRDYLPPEAGARSEIRRRMRAVARRCGYQELETPSVESIDLFRVKSGDEIGEELWAFSDKGGRPVTLVAETTPSLARVFVERAKAEPLPVKWFTVSKLWRYEEPQAGRTREFLQFNLDILGAPGVEAEADLLATASLLLDEVGAADLYVFRLNDRVLADALGTHFGVKDRVRYFRALDRFHKAPAPEVDGTLEAAGLAPSARARLREIVNATGEGVPVSELARTTAEWRAWGLGVDAGRALDRLDRLGGLLERLGVSDRVRFDPTVVRGLAYYTTTVFEAFARTGGRSLFGGGRYDQLIELFGGPATPACGLAIGDQTLELLLHGGGRWPDGEAPLDTYVVAVNPELAPFAFEWVARLRRAGISADCDLMGRSLSRQLKEAARRHARRALLLAPKELARGRVVERDLTTGNQRELPPEEILPSA